jgi:Protease inhibitor Inh
MNFGAVPGAAQGTIAPEGGCPGNFFTSRNWTYERDTLIVHDFKGRRLAQLAYSGDHFEGQDNDGTALTLSR